MQLGVRGSGLGARDYGSAAYPNSHRDSTLTLVLAARELSVRALSLILSLSLLLAACELPSRTLSLTLNPDLLLAAGELSARTLTPTRTPAPTLPLTLAQPVSCLQGPATPAIVATGYEEGAGNGAGIGLGFQFGVGVL